VNKPRNNGRSGGSRKVVIAPPGSASKGAEGGRKVTIAPPGSASKDAKSDRKVTIAPAGSASKSKPESSPKPAPKPATADTKATTKDEAPAKMRAPQRSAPVYIQRRHQPAPQGKTSADPATSSRPAAAKKAAPRRSMAVVIATCNDESRIADRIAGWRAIVTAMDTRWVVLDFGSTDGTVAAVQPLRVELIQAPGGRVDILATLDRCMRETEADVVVFVDAVMEPDAIVHTVADRAAAGASLVVPQVRLPGLVAVSRGTWKHDAFAGHFDLIDWAEHTGHSVGVRTTSGGLSDDKVDNAPISRLVDGRKRRLLRRLAWRTRERLERLGDG